MSHDDQPWFGATETGTGRTLSLPAGPESPSRHDEPDRMGVHIWLEGLLLLGLAGAMVLLYRTDAAPFETAVHRDALFVAVVPLLLTAMATAIALRIGVVNLSVGTTALASAVLFAENASRGTVAAIGIALGGAVVVAVALTILVNGFRAPGWLASGGVAAVTGLWCAEHVDLATLNADPLPRLAADQAWIWLISVGALSIAGGIMTALTGWRSRLGACRAVAETGRRRPKTAGTTVAALTASSLLGGLAGIWLMWSDASGGPLVWVPLDPFLLTAFGLGAALLGGTSARGRYGGVLGTLLAGGLVATLIGISVLDGWSINPLWLALAAVGVGLIVSRLVEAYGRPAAGSTDSESPTMVDTHGYDASIDAPDSEYRLGDIDPYRGVSRPDGSGYR